MASLIAAYKSSRALGFRDVRREEDIVPRPPTNKAWIAVRENRQRAASEVFVTIREVGPADANAPTPIAGVIGLTRMRLSGLVFRDTSGFPQSGGYNVLPNVVYAISVETKGAAGNALKALPTPSRGVQFREGNPRTASRALDGQHYVFAAGAIVDFAVTL